MYCVLIHSWSIDRLFQTVGITILKCKWTCGSFQFRIDVSFQKYRREVYLRERVRIKKLIYFNYNISYKGTLQDTLSRPFVFTTRPSKRCFSHKRILNYVPVVSRYCMRIVWDTNCSWIRPGTPETVPRSIVLSLLWLLSRLPNFITKTQFQSIIAELLLCGHFEFYKRRNNFWKTERQLCNKRITRFC